MRYSNWQNLYLSDSPSLTRIKKITKIVTLQWHAINDSKPAGTIPLYGILNCWITLAAAQLSLVYFAVFTNSCTFCPFRRSAKVSPLLFTRSICAPWLRRTWATLAGHGFAMAARCSGVLPSSSFTFGSAPTFSRTFNQNILH